MSGKGQTLLEMKMRAKAREDEERAKAARKRNILVLILDYLCKSGYTDSLDRLTTESSVSLSKWSVADNVDLNSVVQEFEQFYEMKYSRAPRLVRPATGDDVEEIEKMTKARRRTAAPVPALPAGMGSTPSAMPAHYRSSYAAVDAYQGNGMDAATGMTHSGGASIEQQSVGAGGPKSIAAAGPAGSPQKDPSRVRSAKGSKAEKIAAAIAAGAAATAAEAAGVPGAAATAGASSTGRALSKGDSKGARSHKPGSSLDFSIQGNASSSLAAAANPTPAAAAPPMGSGKPARARPAPSPARSPTPDEDGTVAAGGTDHASYYETRILKPMPEYADSQFRELAHVITRDIYSENPNVRWSDIAELEEAKQLLKEAVVMPLKFPQFFTGLLSPWKGVLLYGPPGTGKTMLARAVATECKTTFFNISASSIVSKFRGDSEKLVRVLFELARYHAPSTIFLDEIDSIMGRRDAAGEHEGSRRLKTEVLLQLDGLVKSDDLVFVLAASNLPWDLDVALLRRLEKRILVPLPNELARYTIIRKLLVDETETRGDDGHAAGGAGRGGRARGVDYQGLARRTEGYSGSDITLLCKEAAMRPVRRLMKLLLSVDEAVSPEAVSSDVTLDPVTDADVQAALACTRPSAQSKFLEKYAEWHADFGAGLQSVDAAPAPSPSPAPAHSR